MSDSYIVEHCSPTLAGIKTGNLFSIRRCPGQDINEELRALNRRIRKLGLRAIPVRYRTTYTLVYLYRPDYLSRDLKNPKVSGILKLKGYPCRNEKLCVAHLAKHLTESEDFPHEIGLFLSYPPSDVWHFMTNPKSGLLCSGCWKVYSNKEKAEKTFTRFKECTESYRRRIKNGATLESLIVQRERKVK